MLGGDTDSVAAIAGAISGANLGSDKLPKEWLDGLAEWPRNKKWMQQLAQALSQPPVENQQLAPPKMHWMVTIPRNIAFATVVLGIGFRRLLPPY